MEMNAGEIATNVHAHGTALDAKKKKVQCHYCGKVVSGFYRLKYHLAGIRGDVSPCEQVLPHVKEQFKMELEEKKREKLRNDVGGPSQGNLPVKRIRSDLIRDMGSQREEEPSNHNLSGQRSQGGDTEVVRNLICETFESRISEIATRIGVTSEATRNRASEMENKRRQSKRAIARFFYENGIDINAANYATFPAMMNAIFGDGYERDGIPSTEELKGWILREELREVNEYVERMKQSWQISGLSILLDGWTDEDGRNLVSFIADCPQGQVYLRTCDVSPFIGDDEALQRVFEGVVQEVGPSDVVQIILSSTEGWMGDVALEGFMRNRSSVFQTVSATHCIELMLKKMIKRDYVRKVLDDAKSIARFVLSQAKMKKLFKDLSGKNGLVKASKVKSAIPFLTLENMVSERQSLKTVFSSFSWEASDSDCAKEVKRVYQLVEKDSPFWSGAMTALKATLPLLRFLRVINGTGKPPLMGYLYESMDRVKEEIKKEFDDDEPSYLPVWNLIDEVWNGILHSPLHAAGYYLNPKHFYAKEFCCDDEVCSGLACCIVQMTNNRVMEDLICQQLQDYKDAVGAFSWGKANIRSNCPPDMWWAIYGENYPELQRFAIRILSQTCDGASKYGLKRSIAEKMLKYKMANSDDQQHMRDLEYVHYHLQLKNFIGEEDDMFLHDLDQLDDWI